MKYLKIFICVFLTFPIICLGVVSAFSATWDTSKNSTGSTNITTIKLPLYSGGIYNFTVNWGDGKAGNVTTYNSVNATHTYSSQGVYTINITGTINGFRFANAGDKLKLINVTQWGNLQTGNLNGYFYGCANLYISATDNLNLTGVTNLVNMFRSATNFNGNISNWNVSGITTMNSMFQSATNFNSNITNWNIGKVVNITSMFDGATSFNQDISSWNTGNVVLMDSMFNGATNFNQPIGNWDTSSVTNMANMFALDPAFNQNLTGWNTSKLKTITTMFAFASAFNGNVSNWDTSKVNDMSYAFDVAYNFNQDVSKWNTSSVTNMANMFALDPAFNQNISGWDTSKVNDMSYMFYNNSIFNQSIGNWNTSNVNDMAFMFFGAINFNQNLNNWDTSKVTLMNSMFSGATSFNGNISAWNTGKVTNMGDMFFKAYNFNQNLENWNTSSVTSLVNMFYNAISFNQNLSNWDVSNIKNMNNLFKNATSFNGNISAWDTHNFTSMTNAFYGASSFNQPLNNWNTSNVKNMADMFWLASSFNQSLNHWDTSSVTNMEDMFYLATSFNQPLNSWNTNSLTVCDVMFGGATSFNQNLNNWNMSGVTLLMSMFNGATSFNGNISNWNTGKATSMSGMFSNAASFNKNLGGWNVSKVTSMSDMFLGVTLSTANYDALLIGWASLSPNLKNNVVLNAGNSTYSDTSASAKNLLINFHNWNIIDGNSYIDTISPSVNVSISQAVIYYNQNITFTANYSDDTGLNQSIFVFDALANQTFLISGLTNQTIINQMITQPAETNVSWYFDVYDLFENYNQSATQSFVVQAIPTSLSLSTDKNLYEQAYKNISLFPIYIDLEAKYFDTLNNQSVLGANCFISNSETNQLNKMIYNSTTENYFYQMPTTEYYGNITFNANCQNSNYISQNTSKSVDVYFYAYLWDSTNKTLYNGQSTNIYLSRTLPNSSVINTLSQNVVVGDNLLYDFNYYGAGDNGSFNRQYILTGNNIFNISASLNSSTCEPYVCFYMKDLLFNKIYKTCGSPQSIIPNQFNYISLIDNTNTTLLQRSFIGIELRANCSVSQNLGFSYVANTSAYPAITFTSAQPFVIGYAIIDFGQTDKNYTIYSNTKINSSRWAVLNITNDQNSSYQQIINFVPRFDFMYLNSIIPNKTYIYNSTKELFASDDISVNPFELAIVRSSNQISWLSEMIPSLSSLNESVNATMKDTITDDEILTFNNGITKSYNITIGTIFTSTLTIYNLTVISNYSSYGIVLPNDLTIYYTNSTGTYNITNQVTIDTVNHYFIMPEIPSFTSGVNYEIVANRELVPPYFTTIPSDDLLFYGNESLGVQFIATDNMAFDSYAVNDTRFSIDQTGFLSNATSLAVGNYQLNITINDTSNNINWTIYNIEIKASVSAENCAVCNETCSPCGGGCTTTDMNFMYGSTTNFDATYGDITGWDTSCITNMDAMFYYSDFNQDISGWNTSSVTDMSLMFANDQSFNQNIGSWDVSKVTDMDSIFFEDNLSTTNYDAILNGWASQVVKGYVPFDGGYSMYSSTGLIGRDILKNTYHWFITDGGLNVIEESADTTPPTYSDVSINNTASEEIILFSVNMADDIALNSNGQYIFSTNNTGEWINDSSVNFTTTPSWANVTKILNSTVGMAVGYMWYFSDNTGNTNSTAPQTIILNSFAPDLLLVNPTNTTYNTTDILVNISSKGDSIWYNWNGTNLTYTTPIIVTFAEGSNTLHAYANNSEGNTNQTIVTFFIILPLPGPSPVNLGTASNFAILAGLAISNTGSSIINGDIGSYSTVTIEGFPPGIVNGTNHMGDGVTQEAKNNLTTAYNDIEGRTPVSTVPSELGGTTRTSGIYDSSSGTFGITGNLTLNADGNSSAIFIFKMATTLTTASDSNVVLTNGAKAENVFWQVGSSATLGTYSTFKGNILALTSITLTTDANVEGRLLAQNGAVTLDSNNVSSPIVIVTADTTPPYFITIPANASLFYGNESLGVDFDATDAIGFGYYSINDSRFSITQTGLLTNTTHIGVGNYAINVTINDTSNNINWTTYLVEVNASNYSNCIVYFNTTNPISYPETFIVYTNCDSDYTLYQNGTTITNASTINSGAGYYNFTVQRTDTSNYTDTKISEFFTVYKNVEDCQVLFNETSPLEASKTFKVWANCATPFALMKNGTNISNNSEQILNVGAYNFSLLRTDSQNYSNIYNEKEFIINSTPIPVISTPPAYTEESVNNTLINQITNFAINVDDNITLHPNGEYIFSTNNTGEWINDSSVNFTTTPSWANVTEILNSTVGMAVGYMWYFSNNAGNTSSTPEYIIITSSEIIPVIIPPHYANGCVYNKNYNWNCSSWGECIEGEQTRICKEKNNCGKAYGRPETQRACEEITENVTGNIFVSTQLFDIKTELNSDTIKNLNDLLATTSFTNFGNVSTPINLTYRILDSSGNEVYNENGSIIVITEQVIRKSFENIKLPDGKYTLILATAYNSDDSRPQEEFRQYFEIKNTISPGIAGNVISSGEPKYLRDSLILVGVVIVGIASIVFYTRKRKMKLNIS